MSVSTTLPHYNPLWAPSCLHVGLRLAHGPCWSHADTMLNLFHPLHAQFQLCSGPVPALFRPHSCPILASFYPQPALFGPKTNQYTFYLTRPPQSVLSARLSSRHIVPTFENTLKVAGTFRKWLYFFYDPVLSAHTVYLWYYGIPRYPRYQSGVLHTWFLALTMNNNKHHIPGKRHRLFIFKKQFLNCQFL